MKKFFHHKWNRKGPPDCPLGVNNCHGVIHILGNELQNQASGKVQMQTKLPESHDEYFNSQQNTHLAAWHCNACFCSKVC